MQTPTINTVNLTGFNKIANVTVAVPYRQPGNIIEHVLTKFEVWKNEPYFKVLPLCTEERKRIANLPDALQFQVKSGKIFMVQKQYEEIVCDIWQELSKMILK